MCERATPPVFARLWERPYPGTTDQVRHVRAALREFLAGCPVADDVVHLLSELSANAIAHSDSGNRDGAFTVRAEHFPGSYVRGEVEDQGSAWDGDLPASARHRTACTCWSGWPPTAASSRSGLFTSSGSASTIPRRDRSPRFPFPAHMPALIPASAHHPDQENASHDDSPHHVHWPCRSLWPR